MRMSMSLIQAMLADLLAQQGDEAAARSRAELAVSRSDLGEERGFDLALRVLHRLDLQAGDFSAAESRREAMYRHAEQANSLREKLLADVEAACALEHPEARRQVGAIAISALREMGMPGVAERADYRIRSAG